MLCLYRKCGEKIYLVHEQTGERIELTMLEHSKAKGRIGIDAPQGWRILRAELLDEPETEGVV